MSSNAFTGLRSHILIDYEDKRTTLETAIQRVDPATTALWIAYDDHPEHPTPILTKDSFAHLPNLRVLYFENGGKVKIESLPDTIEALMVDASVEFKFSKDILPNLKHLQVVYHLSMWKVPKSVQEMEIVDGMSSEEEQCGHLDVYQSNLIELKRKCSIKFVSDDDTTTRGMVSKFFPRPGYADYVL